MFADLLTFTEELFKGNAVTPNKNPSCILKFSGQQTLRRNGF